MTQTPEMVPRQRPPDDAVESRAVRVTFFEDRAEVVRRAVVAVEAGNSTVRISGLGPFADERSLQVRPGAEGVGVVSARLRYELDWEVKGDGEPGDAEEALSAARGRVSLARSAVARAVRVGNRNLALLEEWAGGLARLPDELESNAAAWRQAFETLSRAQREAVAAQSAARRERQECDLAFQLAERRYQQRRERHPVLSIVVLLQLEAQEPGGVELELVYRTPAAVWRPEHLARLERDADRPDGGTVEIITWATAWQHTGENWRDVEVRFSTARPAQAASAPLLADDVLISRRKSAEEQRVVSVEMREQEVAVAGLEGRRAATEMPGVDDGGEPLLLDPEERVSIPSTGQPFRVEVSRIRLPARVERVLYPEKAPVAHFKASTTLEGSRPLLAGPVRIAREDSLVGLAKMDLVAPGEPFEVGFGVDDAIRVRRRVESKRKRTAVTGTQRVARKVELFLSNVSGEVRTVQLSERVPVSEIEAVEVELGERAHGWTFEADDGFLTREVVLEPRGHAELELDYEIRAKSNVSLPI